MIFLNESVREAAHRSVLVMRVTSVAAIVAPSYRFYPDDTTEASQVEAAMRAYNVHPTPREKP